MSVETIRQCPVCGAWSCSCPKEDDQEITIRIVRAGDIPEGGMQLAMEAIRAVQDLWGEIERLREEIRALQEHTSDNAAWQSAVKFNGV